MCYTNDVCKDIHVIKCDNGTLKSDASSNSSSFARRHDMEMNTNNSCLLKILSTSIFFLNFFVPLSERPKNTYTFFFYILLLIYLIGCDILFCLFFPSQQRICFVYQQFHLRDVNEKKKRGLFLAERLFLFTSFASRAN